MSAAMIYELIGYLASILVAISLMMTSVLRLRVINMIGAITFTVYGLLIQAYPVAAVNVLIVGINIYHISRMYREREYFRVLEMQPDAEYADEFLRFHEEEIRSFQPGFERPSGPEAIALFVLRDLVPAGLLLGRVEGDVLRVDLDFVIPGYRDLKVGDYLFRQRAELFREKGVRRIVSPAGTDEHARYLERMGFRRSGEGVMEREVE